MVIFPDTPASDSTSNATDNHRNLCRKGDTAQDIQKEANCFQPEEVADIVKVYAIYAHQIARARAEASGVRTGVFSVLREA